MSEYPEHDKLSAIKDRTQAIGEFLDWAAQEKGAHLMRWVDGGYNTVEVAIRPLLAEWAGIDEDKLEAEKRAMLAKLRGENEHKGYGK